MANDILLTVGADISSLATNLSTGSKKVKSFGSSSSAAAKKIALVTAAATAAAVAIGNMVSSSAQAATEIKNLAALSNTTVSKFQSMAYAASLYGIEQDKLADILKDTQDKIGDFIETGGGPLADFFENIAPQIGLTADELQNLSGPNALEAYVSALESANLSQAQMTFYMEAIASDSTALTKLFANQGEELERLSEEYEKAYGAIRLTTEEAESLTAVTERMNKVSESAELAAQKLSAKLAPAMTSFLDIVDARFVASTNFLINFINRFIEAENITTIAELEKQIESTTKKLAKANEEFLSLSENARPAAIQNASQAVRELEERLDALNKQLKAVKDKTAETEGGVNIEVGVDKYSPQIQAYLEYQQAMAEYDETLYADELMRLQTHHENMMSTYQQYYDARSQQATDAAEAEKAKDEQVANIKRQAMESVFSGLSSLMSSENEKLFDIGKAAALSQATVDAISTTITAFRKGNAIGGPPVGAAYAATASAAQWASVASLASTKYGSSSGSSSSSSSTTSSTTDTSSSESTNQTSVAISLEGDTFSASSVDSLISSINDRIQDGAEITGISVV
jgi:hypothetical protein